MTKKTAENSNIYCNFTTILHECKIVIKLCKIWGVITFCRVIYFQTIKKTEINSKNKGEEEKNEKES